MTEQTAETSGGDYAILVSLSTREEAEVAAAALRAQGVDAFLGNDHHASVMTLGGVQALGGMQVMVPRSQLSEAKELLRSRLKEWADGEDDEAPTGRRDRWKAWLLLAMLFAPLLIGIALAFGERLARMLGW
jgi:hypothetical protein